MDFSSGGLGRGDDILPARPVAGAGSGLLDPLRSLLHSISSRLSDRELGEMKFLRRDRIGKGKLDGVKKGVEFFDILMERQEITKDNLGLLKQLLQHIDRRDLLAEVQQFEEGQPYVPGDQPDEHEQRRLKAAVQVICGNIGREWKRLMRELGMSEVNLDRIEAAYPLDLRERLFKALGEWQKGKGKDAKVADLIQALRGCDLNLVADRVEERISQLNTGTR